MKEHLGRHLADLFALEFGIPDDPISPAKINSDLRETIVHRQCKSVTLHPAFVLQGQRKGLAERDRNILDSVMLIDMQIAFCIDAQVEAAVTRKLFEHVIKKGNAGDNFESAFAVKI